MPLDAELLGDRHRVIIGPGDFYATRGDEVITTVLGSCVCVCLRDPETGAGGMNHFMLPEPLDQSDFFFSDAGRYGINAMELLINRLLELGAARHRLKAKVFGGGNVLEGVGMRDRIPASNVAFALSFLAAENIPVLAQDVGGNRGRKVHFFVGVGKAFVQKLGKPAAEIERHARPPRSRAGEVVLFEKEGQRPSPRRLRTGTG